MHNLLSDRLIDAAPLGRLTLPGVLAALSRDGVESFPALRPHQAPAWHMGLVQMAALALHQAKTDVIPEDEAAWVALLRGLTPDFPDDEPWCLAVRDWSRPAFLQPPVPDGIKLAGDVPTPDALDLLITSKNHDIKQSVARDGEPQDWLYALVSLQTGEGYGGRDNHGIARMNGGSSSRPMVTLAPLPEDNAKSMTPRPGAWFRRDVRVLLATRPTALEESGLDYPETGGIGLTWTVPWLDGEQLRTRDLDLWFVEICRRIRLVEHGDRLSAVKGLSTAPRIQAKPLNGALGDPWAPVHKTENKSFTLAGGDFDYRTLIELLLSGNWALPLLARPASFETPQTPLVLVAAALARGNSKTEGFKSRALPLSGKVARALWSPDRRDALHQMAKAQAETIADFDKALSYTLVLAAVGGEREKISRDSYAHAKEPRTRLGHFADTIFFDHLWRRFEAQDQGSAAVDQEKTAFAARLWERTQAIFEQFLPIMPGPSLYRPRAEARARSMLWAMVRKAHPEIFPAKSENSEVTNAA